MMKNTRKIEAEFLIIFSGKVQKKQSVNKQANLYWSGD
jgi:hypothetical protein